ncbi:hypothetical protein MQE36_14880 [Zhouia spongiae]|uniref:Uncharacterized protein n=1 Tax=Zhouia spongiae TaxID=2202721 RepID=A0ABY3YMG5_9FLAO|nr:hypothetical protein [Zhouia spongiae]UNY98358.1 hypothetical protein MQE36_14880 [Zhouia spongiae]
MNYNKENIEEILNNSIDELFEKDSQIIFESYNLHERSIAHRLAIYIENHFRKTDYVVDVEYNRMRNKYGEDIIGNLIGKNLDFEKYGKKLSNVYPDIIVHKRDTDNNLLEIELKMQWKNSKRDFDYIKINEYIEQLSYKFGVYIELSENREECVIEFGPFKLSYF